MLKPFKWFYFLSKRLYKKLTFIVLILLIPLSVFAFSLTTNEKTGFISIALVNEDKGGTGDEILHKLIDHTKVINFIEYQNKDIAINDLDTEHIDAVWVFPENLDDRIKTFANDSSADNYIVDVSFKENNLMARLPLEKLSGVFYPYLSKQFYLRFVRENPDFDLSKLSDDVILSYYDGFINEADLFRFSYPDSNTQIMESETNYLVSPVRGILSVIVVICGFAAAMVFIGDEQRGTFGRAKASNRVLISFSSQLTAVINVGVFAFISIFILGLNAAPLRETVMFIIFAINTALFCTVLQQFISNMYYYAAIATLLSVLQAIIEPIFFNFKIQIIPQLFFPNTYYINSVHSNTYFIYSFIYMAVLSIVLSLFYFKKRRL